MKATACSSVMPSAGKNCTSGRQSKEAKDRMKGWPQSMHTSPMLVEVTSGLVLEHR